MVKLIGILFDCYYFLWHFQDSSFTWSSISTSDHVDEGEATLHFHDCKFTFCNAKSQSTRSMIILTKNEEIE